MSYKKCLKEIYIIEKELDNLFKNTKKIKVQHVNILLIKPVKVW